MGKNYQENLTTLIKGIDSRIKQLDDNKSALISRKDYLLKKYGDVNGQKVS